MLPSTPQSSSPEPRTCCSTGDPFVVPILQARGREPRQLQHEGPGGVRGARVHPEILAAGQDLALPAGDNGPVRGTGPCWGPPDGGSGAEVPPGQQPPAPGGICSQPLSSHSSGPTKPCPDSPAQSRPHCTPCTRSSPRAGSWHPQDYSSSLPPGFSRDRAIPSATARGQPDPTAARAGGAEAGSHLNRGLFLFSASSGGTKDIGVRGTMLTACRDKNRSAAAVARGGTGGAGTAWAAPSLGAPPAGQQPQRLRDAGGRKGRQQAALRWADGPSSCPRCPGWCP